MLSFICSSQKTKITRFSVLSHFAVFCKTCKNRIRSLFIFPVTYILYTLGVCYIHLNIIIHFMHLNTYRSTIYTHKVEYRSTVHFSILTVHICSTIYTLKQILYTLRVRSIHIYTYCTLQEIALYRKIYILRESILIIIYYSVQKYILYTQHTLGVRSILLDTVKFWCTL